MDRLFLRFDRTLPHCATMSDKPKMTGGNKGGNDSVGTTYTQGGGGGNKTGGSSASSDKASGK